MWYLQNSTKGAHKNSYFFIIILYKLYLTGNKFLFIEMCIQIYIINVDPGIYIGILDFK